MEKEPEIIRTSLRMNRRLYDLLADAAEKRGLTMHAEIIARLEASFEAPQPGLSDEQIKVLGMLADSLRTQIYRTKDGQHRIRTLSPSREVLSDDPYDPENKS